MQAEHPPQYKDFPFTEICLVAERLSKQGALVYQKFSCDNCNSRQTIPTANTFHTQGKCEECGHVTDLVKKGGNYLTVWSTEL